MSGWKWGISLKLVLSHSWAESDWKLRIIPKILWDFLYFWTWKRWKQFPFLSLPDHEWGRNQFSGFKTTTFLIAPNLWMRDQFDRRCYQCFGVQKYKKPQRIFGEIPHLQLLPAHEWERNQFGGFKTTGFSILPSLWMRVDPVWKELFSMIWYSKI